MNAQTRKKGDIHGIKAWISSSKTKRMLKTKRVSKPSSKTRKNTKTAKKTIIPTMNLLLKKRCPDPANCISFDYLLNIAILTYFNNFHDFQYLKHIKKIGEDSQNGFVNLLTYEKEEYVAYAVLKSSVQPNTDNLYYEYLVGKFLNKQLEYFPCFINTYGAFYYNNDKSWQNVKEENIQVSKLNSNLIPIPDATSEPGIINNLEISCSKSKYITILVEYLKAVSFKDKYPLTLNIFDINDTCELCSNLFQIYMPLMCLKNNFTHYDLHPGNALLTQPSKNKYIEFYYHMKNNVIVSFKSYYVSKIIDYGRCFFKDETNSDIDGYSLKIHQQLGRINACEPDSGIEVGYWLLQDNRNTSDYHYLELITKNQSQDLRLLHYYYNHLSLINKPQLVLDTAYGKKESKATGLPNNINNVTDACKYLQDVLVSDDFKKINNDVYSNASKFGDLHIFMDETPIYFVEANVNTPLKRNILLNSPTSKKINKLVTPFMMDTD